MALVPLNDRFKLIENSTLRVSFSIILNDHLIGLVAMVYPVNSSNVKVSGYNSDQLILNSIT